MLVRLLVILLVVSGLTTSALAQDSDTQTNHTANIAKRFSKKQTYDLRYKLKAGDKIDFLFEQVVSTQTRMGCLLYTSPSPRDRQKSRMPSSA